MKNNGCMDCWEETKDLYHCSFELVKIVSSCSQFEYYLFISYRTASPNTLIIDLKLQDIQSEVHNSFTGVHADQNVKFYNEQ